MVIYYIDKLFTHLKYEPCYNMRALFDMAQVLKYLKLLWCANYCWCVHYFNAPLSVTINCNKDILCLYIRKYILVILFSAFKSKIGNKTYVIFVGV